MISGHLLYSANPHLKLYVQQQYQDDVHYVWCSGCFDPQAAPRLSNASRIPPSSSPKDICRALHAAVARGDRHDPKIVEQRAGIIGRATKWAASGAISAGQRDEILYLAEKSELKEWRPLLYVIPRALVAARLRRVPMADRAGIGDEFVIPDLRRNEFDVIEWEG